MPDRQALLFANEAFYRAFADRDVTAMDGLWSREATVACIHPGWPPLVGREAVMESWRRILTGASPPKVNCLRPQAFVYDGVAFVICHEEIEGTYLVATNVFRREGKSWRLVHHHAGPAPEPPAEEDEPSPPPRAN